MRHGGRCAPFPTWGDPRSRPRAPLRISPRGSGKPSPLPRLSCTPAELRSCPLLVAWALALVPALPGMGACTIAAPIWESLCMVDPEGKREKAGIGDRLHRHRHRCVSPESTQSGWGRPRGMTSPRDGAEASRRRDKAVTTRGNRPEGFARDGVARWRGATPAQPRGLLGCHRSPGGLASVSSWRSSLTASACPASRWRPSSTAPPISASESARLAP